ncbi:unnamed protein product, partial [Closterium sp. NIES-65]
MWRVSYQMTCGLEWNPSSELPDATCVAPLPLLPSCNDRRRTTALSLPHALASHPHAVASHPTMPYVASHPTMPYVASHPTMPYVASHPTMPYVASHPTMPYVASHPTMPYVASHPTMPYVASHPTMPYVASHPTMPYVASHPTMPYVASHPTMPYVASHPTMPYVASHPTMPYVASHPTMPYVASHPTMPYVASHPTMPYVASHPTMLYVATSTAKQALWSPRTSLCAVRPLTSRPPSHLTAQLISVRTERVSLLVQRPVPVSCIPYHPHASIPHRAAPTASPPAAQHMGVQKLIAAHGDGGAAAHRGMQEGKGESALSGMCQECAMVVLQLILARRRVRVLVKDAKEATAGFGPYVQPIAGSVGDQAAVRAALRGSQAVIVTGRLGSLAQLLQGSKADHVVLVSQLGASSRPSGLAGLLWSASPLAAAADAEAALAVAAVAAGVDGERGAAGEARHWGFGCTVVRGGKVVDEPGRQRGLLLGQGDAMRGSVSREDLAAVVAAALAVPPPVQQRRIIE